MYAKKNVSVKVLVVLLCVVLLIGGAIGGTVAYLMTNTDPVTNTFTAGDVNITLVETKPTENTAIMVPGHYIEKDPKVTVLADSEDCYVFVKIDESANFDTFMTYGIADGWQELTGNAGVYWREVNKTDTDLEFAVLKDDKVTVIDTVTKEMLTADDFTNPTLTFTAYAIQKYSSNETKFGAANAWEQINATP